jgi:type II secretory pathway pseudopilin PulG
MKAERSHPVARRAAVSLRSSEAGFSVLELIVIIVIIAVVIAVGVPTLHSRARASVLDANLRSLATVVQEGVLEGYSGEYRASGAGNPEQYLSNYLEEALRGAGEGGYVNPVAGTSNGRMVLNYSSLPGDLGGVPPAVFITDSAEYQHGFGPAVTEAACPSMAGALIVAFDSTTKIVDVYYIDEGGRQSEDVLHVPLT